MELNWFPRQVHFHIFPLLKLRSLFYILSLNDLPFLLCLALSFLFPFDLANCCKAKESVTISLLSNTNICLPLPPPILGLDFAFVRPWEHFEWVVALSSLLRGTVSFPIFVPAFALFACVFCIVAHNEMRFQFHGPLACAMHYVICFIHPPRFHFLLNHTHLFLHLRTHAFYQLNSFWIEHNMYPHDISSCILCSLCFFLFCTHTNMHTSPLLLIWQLLACPSRLKVPSQKFNQ